MAPSTGGMMDALLAPVRDVMDPLWFDAILITLGLGLLFLGGESLIRGAVSLATRLGLSKLVIGLTVVGMGTSAPELLVSLQAALRGAPDLAVGNVVGSNIANILLIMGLGALLSPMVAKTGSVARDVAVVIVVTIGLWYLAHTGGIDARDGLIMLGALGVYLLFVFIMERRAPTVEDVDASKPMHPLMAMVWVSLGLLMLVTGADSLVSGASHIARHFGVSEAIIGLSLVAVGTSLPELTVTVIAAFRKQGDISLGNLIGSNIFNVLGILGITASVAYLPVNPQITQFDIPVALGVAVMLGVIIIAFKKVGRLSALLFLGLYALYIGWLFKDFA